MTTSRTRRLAIWAGTALGAVVLLSAAAIWYTSQPGFCRSCHIMETRYVSWSRSTHAEDADCLDCHAEPGVIGEIVAHLNGARYLYVLVTGREQVILRARVPEGTCVECHDPEDLPERTEGVELAHDAHFDVEVRCEECHQGFHDEVAEGGRMQAGLGTCLDCHPGTVLPRTRGPDGDGDPTVDAGGRGAGGEGAGPLGGGAR